jgi:RNA polymerase sigma-70 factor (ECF subfamily)
MLSVCRQYMTFIHRRYHDLFYESVYQFEELQYKGSFEGWIRRIMVNECISFIRVDKKKI